MNSAPSPTGKAKHAWREVERTGPPKRSAEKRIADFHEIYSLYDEDTVREQASRCIQCPDASCVKGCPLTNRIPEWISLAAEGDFLGDYLAITALGNKVYGAWAHQTSEEAKTERGKKTRTVLRVGSADFN